MIIVVRNELGLAFLLLFLSFVLLALWRVRTGRPELRPIPAFPALQAAVREAAESARPLHISLGGGGIGDPAAMQTLAGLQVLRELAQPAATATARLVVTTASPAALPLAQGSSRSPSTRPAPPMSTGRTACVSSPIRAALMRWARAARPGGRRPSATCWWAICATSTCCLPSRAAQKGQVLVAGSGDMSAQPFVWATGGLPSPRRGDLRRRRLPGQAPPPTRPASSPRTTCGW